VVFLSQGLRWLKRGHMTCGLRARRVCDSNKIRTKMSELRYTPSHTHASASRMMAVIKGNGYYRDALMRKSVTTRLKTILTTSTDNGIARAQAMVCNDNEILQHSIKR